MKKEAYEEIHTVYHHLNDILNNRKEHLERTENDLELVYNGTKICPLLNYKTDFEYQRINEIVAEHMVETAESNLKISEKQFNDYVEGLFKCLVDRTDKTYLYYGINKENVYKYRQLLTRKYVYFNLDDKEHENFIDNNNVIFFEKSIPNPDIREQDFEEIRRNYILYILNTENYKETSSFDGLKRNLYSGSIRVREARNK